MLHEIILALNGSSDTVMHEIMQMNDFHMYCHPSESQLLYKILDISKKYAFLKKVVDKVPMIFNKSIELDEYQLTPGMYLQAYCEGLREGLEPYRMKVVQLEQLILETPRATLSVVVCKMNKFTLLVDTLTSITKQILTRNIHGCKILQHIHTSKGTENDLAKSALNRITDKCHQIMLRQLTSLLLNGDIVDPYKEFFIQAVPCEENNLNTSFSTLDSESVMDIELENQSVFKIFIEFLPSYIPMSLANKALYIGNTILMLSKDDPNRNTGQHSILQDSLMKQIEALMLNRLDSLQRSNLDVSLLGNMIDDVQACVTEHFWKLAKEVADIYGQLKLCKDIYLLGQGQLFLEFLEKAANILRMPLATHSNKDLNNIWKNSIQNCIIDEKGLDKFYFKLPAKNSVAAGTSVWSVLQLEFKVSWPLHLLFTQSVIGIYNTVFRFLLKIKKVELKMHGVWITLVKNKSKTILKQELQLCNVFMFLIQNLQDYIHWDVLECQDNIFQNTLKKSCDFQQILQAHNNFLANIVNQAFLQSNEVSQDGQPPISQPDLVNKYITDILDLGEEFCNVIGLNDRGEKLHTITIKLKLLITFLLNFMADLSRRGTDNHLSKLLLRLDYNKFFSNNINEPNFVIS